MCTVPNSMQHYSIRYNSIITVQYPKSQCTPFNLLIRKSVRTQESVTEINQLVMILQIPT